jgi:hypothetical protein
MLENKQNGRLRRITAGADKAYDGSDFLRIVWGLNVTPVKKDRHGRNSNLDRRTSLTVFWHQRSGKPVRLPTIGGNNIRGTWELIRDSCVQNDLYILLFPAVREGLDQRRNGL